MRQFDKGFYYGLIVAIEMIDAEGYDSLIEELLRAVDIDKLQAIAASEPEANAGTLKHIARMMAPSGEHNEHNCRTRQKGRNEYENLYHSIYPCGDCRNGHCLRWQRHIADCGKHQRGNAEPDRAATRQVQRALQ